MIIKLYKTFERQYGKLRVAEIKRIKKVVALFKKNPHAPALRNHALSGKMKGERAISAGGDLRLIFREYENYTLVLFLQVGTHNQVY